MNNLSKNKIEVVVFHKNPKTIYKERWLSKFFDYIINQTYKDYFLYEINYGEDYFSFLEDYNIENVKFFNLKIENHAHVMNFIITEAFNDGCDFVFNTNCDDYYDLDIIRTEIEIMNQGYDILSSDFCYINILIQ